MNDPKSLAEKIANLLDEKKAGDVAILDISRLTVVADYFVIASGRSEIQVRALFDELEKRMAETGVGARHIDGAQSGRWIAIDYGDVIVHLFHHEERAFYNLERLWADARHQKVSSEPQK